MEESRAVQKYTAWINAKNVDPLIRRELLNIISSPEDITERFSENLTFGTAGLRAVMGAGTNRINIYTVASAAKGLAACLQASDASEEIRNPGSSPGSTGGIFQTVSWCPLSDRCSDRIRDRAGGKHVVSMDRANETGRQTGTLALSIGNMKHFTWTKY